MTEFTSFNALDPDEYNTGPEIVEVGNVNLEIPVKSDD
jgi:hypothetical protein